MAPRKTVKKTAVSDRTPKRALLAAYERNLVDYEARNDPAVIQGPFQAVLAIDPGIGNIALAMLLLANREITDVVTNKFDVSRFGTIGARVYYLEQALRLWIEEYKPTLIVKEGVAHFSPYGIADAGRIQYMIERTAFEFGVPCITVNPQTMRKFMGSKQKSDTKLKVWQRYGREFPSEDETDAFAIAMTGLAGLNGEVTLTKTKKARTRKDHVDVS